MEYIKYAFTGINIIPSMMLAVMIFYWIMAIFGSFAFNFHHKIDIHFNGHSGHHHIDNDSVIESIASSSFPVRIMKFLNIGTVPLTIYLTLLSLILWVLSMLTYYMEISPNSLIGFIFFILFTMASFLLTKIITEPFKSFFIMMDNEEKIEIIGEMCELKFDTDEKSLGQAEIQGKHDILINVISANGTINKGEKVFITGKREEDNVYIVERAELERIK